MFASWCKKVDMRPSWLSNGREKERWKMCFSLRRKESKEMQISWLQKGGHLNTDVVMFMMVESDDSFFLFTKCITHKY